MSNVVEIKTRPVEVSESVIATIDGILADARMGKIVSIAFAGVNLDGSTCSAWSETDDFGKLLGSIARLQHRVNINQDGS